ncbi:hypothetical protein D9M73_231050 [compost metagenome]
MQVADLVFQAQCAGAAEGGQVQRLERAQARTLQLHHLVRLVERLQQRETGAATHIGADTDIELVLLGHRQVEQAAAEEEVRGRAERDGRTCFWQSRALVIAQVHTVGEH